MRYVITIAVMALGVMSAVLLFGTFDLERTPSIAQESGLFDVPFELSDGRIEIPKQEHIEYEVEDNAIVELDDEKERDLGSEDTDMADVDDEEEDADDVFNVNDLGIDAGAEEAQESSAEAGGLPLDVVSSAKEAEKPPAPYTPPPSR